MTEVDTPQALPRLTVDGKEIVLVGTAHVSKESVALVESVIESEQPDTVCVELCQSRYQSIRQNEQWRNMDIVKVIKNKKAFLLLANLMLSAFQKRIGEKVGVRPGEEMNQAITSAESVGAEICLADRDITITMSRTWRSTSTWNRIKLLFQLLLSMGGVGDIETEDIERMKQEDILESILSEMEKSHPAIREILIDERDRYLAEKIRTAPGNRIVAVVGAGHIPGIRRYIHEDIDIAALETLPPKGKVGRVLKWLIPALIVILVASGFAHGGVKTGQTMVLLWIVVHGLCAGLGATIAFGHPITIVSAVVASPLTAANPMIAAGWVSGLVEAFVRKPKVRDLESLPEDILSVRGFWRNKVTRILLVVVFSNLGSAVGTFVAVPMMLRALGH